MQVGNANFAFSLQQLVNLPLLWSLGLHLNVTNATTPYPQAVSVRRLPTPVGKLESQMVQALNFRTSQCHDVLPARGARALAANTGGNPKLRWVKQRSTKCLNVTNATTPHQQAVSARQR